MNALNKRNNDENMARKARDYCAGPAAQEVVACCVNEAEAQTSAEDNCAGGPVSATRPAVFCVRGYHQPSAGAGKHHNCKNCR